LQDNFDGRYHVSSSLTSTGTSGAWHYGATNNPSSVSPAWPASASGNFIVNKLALIFSGSTTANANVVDIDNVTLTGATENESTWLCSTSGSFPSESYQWCKNGTSDTSFNFMISQSNC
jgi:hypothetical protein